MEKRIIKKALIGSFFGKLPEELIWKCFIYMDFSTLVALSSVNSLFREVVISKNRVMKSLFRRLFPFVYERKFRNSRAYVDYFEECKRFLFSPYFFDYRIPKIERECFHQVYSYHKNRKEDDTPIKEYSTSEVLKFFEDAFEFCHIPKKNRDFCHDHSRLRCHDESVQKHCKTLLDRKTIHFHPFAKDNQYDDPKNDCVRFRFSDGEFRAFFTPKRTSRIETFGDFIKYLVAFFISKEGRMDLDLNRIDMNEMKHTLKGGVFFHIRPEKEEEEEERVNFSRILPFHSTIRKEQHQRIPNATYIYDASWNYVSVIFENENGFYYFDA